MIYQCQKCGLSKCDGAMGSVLPQCRCDWTAPASKPWVGLTLEELQEIEREVWGAAFLRPQSARKYELLIEAKLREKNA